MTGMVNSGSKSWKYAAATAVDRPMKAAKANQWRMPTQVHCSMRVWPKVSFSIVNVRPTGLPVRPGAGWPLRITPSIADTARAVRAMATTEMASEITIATICMGEAPLVCRFRTRTGARAEPIANFGDGEPKASLTTGAGDRADARDPTGR